MTINNKLRIKEGRTELTVDHKGKDQTFIYPAYGPDNYSNIRDSIQGDSLVLPTMADTASLVHSVFNSDDKYSNEIKDLIKERWLWTFDKNLYVQKGVYIYPEAISNGKDLEESELVKKLEDGDKSIRFVPYGFDTKSMTSRELAKNAYVRALAGDEGAEKLAEVADKFVNKSYLWTLKPVSKPETRVSALVSDTLLGRRLVLDGDVHGDFRYGHAFGISKGGIGTVGSDASRAQK